MLALLGCAPQAARPPDPSAVPATAAPTAPIATTRTPATSGTPAPSRSPRPSGPTPRASPSPDRVAGWQADLDQLVPAMQALHPDLFHDTPKADIERLLGDLGSRVGIATDDELMVGRHTCRRPGQCRGTRRAHRHYPWSPASQLPVHSLPLRLWLFPDGIHVIAALPPYQDLAGALVETIGSHRAADVVRALDPLVPRDNPATVRLLTPRYLLIPEVLHGLDLVDDAGPVDLGIVDATGATRTTPVTPIPMADYNDWAGPYGLFLPADPGVLYLSRMDEPLWWTKLGDGTLFVQYNRVDFLDRSQVNDLGAEASSPDVKRVVVDIRHNFGGEVQALTPVVDILDGPAIDRPGRLFLITGRNTFSAASLFAAELQARTSVTIVGETMAGSPNTWGNDRETHLQWSGLAVSVATQFEVATTVDDDRLTIRRTCPYR